MPKGRTGGTNSATYCRDVWLKHFDGLSAGGMRSMPLTLAELGPGDSIGVGLAALLSGVNRYYALDVVRFSDADSNLRIFEELAGLFRAREPSLSEKRISLIRSALLSPGSEHDGIAIRYVVPWFDGGVIEPETVDVILSHAVLEHVVDLDRTYRALSLWLKPGGMMSHQIDFTSHGVTEKWNGYRAYPEILWKIIAGRRAYLINRQPCSVHVNLMERYGFTIVSMQKMDRSDGIERSQLSSRWKSISDDDLACSDLFVQARKG
ncbi:MAG TPA: class I SAM-dependent methyltransferase [Candidatus Krumholzibacteriaceae bacterium]